MDISFLLEKDGFELVVPAEIKSGKGAITCSVGKTFDSE